MKVFNPFHSVVEELLRQFNGNVIAVALFGSTARGEAKPTSDLDFLVVLSGSPASPDRRSQVYRCIHNAVTSDGVSRDVTALDMDEKSILDEDAEITPLMLNVVADAVILYDPKGELRSFVDRVKKVIQLAGLERYAVRDGKYGWKPKDGILRKVEA
jgi:predicted nucleotidyltransferase